MTKSKQRRKPIKLEIDDFKTVMHLGLTQKEGAEYLDICLSSFKRQFSKTSLKWPSLNELRFHKHHREMRKRLGRMVDLLEVELSNVNSSSTEAKIYIKHDPSIDLIFDPNHDSKFDSSCDQLARRDAAIDEKIILSLLNAPPASLKIASPFFGDFMNINGPWSLHPDRYINNNIGLMITDSQLNIIACNQVYHQVLGYSPKEMCPYFSHVKKVMLKFYTPDFYISIYNRMLETVNSVRFQNTWLTKIGNPVYLTLTFRKYRPSPTLPYIGYFEFEPSITVSSAPKPDNIQKQNHAPDNPMKDQMLTFSFQDKHI